MMLLQAGLLLVCITTTSAVCSGTGRWVCSMCNCAGAQECNRDGPNGCTEKRTQGCYGGACCYGVRGDEISCGPCSEPCRTPGGVIGKKSCTYKNVSPYAYDKNAPCDGDTRTEDIPCNTHNCPVDCGWCTYGSYGNCTKECGSGLKYRYRKPECEKEMYGGMPCNGSASDVIPCNTHPCPVDGRWCKYGSYGTCDKTCGCGFKYHNRKCACPSPKYGGKPCEGDACGTHPCNTHECPTPQNGRWSDYGSYGSCDKPCGGGTSYRYRTCTHQKYGGKPCSGSTSESQPCNTHGCVVNGGWCEYGSYGGCKTCGDGTEYRTRKCECPTPEYGGKGCSGNTSDVRPCNKGHCPINGGWCGYSAYGGCDKTCGYGLSIHNRRCECPSPKYGGKPCDGSACGSRPCNTECCPDCGKWTDWKDSCTPCPCDTRVHTCTRTRTGTCCPDNSQSRTGSCYIPPGVCKGK